MELRLEALKHLRKANNFQNGFFKSLLVNDNFNLLVEVCKEMTNGHLDNICSIRQSTKIFREEVTSLTQVGLLKIFLLVEEFYFQMHFLKFQV